MIALPALNHKRQMLAATLQDQQKADPGNLLLAHTIGLFHYWWAKALEQEGQLLLAREVWLTVIANWACILAEDSFLSSWSQQRAIVYQKEVTQEDQEAFRNQLKKQLQEDLAAYTERCKQAGKALTEPLYLIFELEIAAFQVVKQIGGIPLPEMKNRRVICGPLMLLRLGLTAAFSDFLFASKPPSEEVPDELADLLKIVRNRQSGVLDEETRILLMQYFSQLGTAALCLKNADPERALTFLEGLYPNLNPSTNASQDGKASHIPLILDARSPKFKERNCGYTRAENPGKLMFTHALQLAIAAYMRRSRLNITAEPMDVPQAIFSWRYALALARKNGLEEQTSTEIRELILGRVMALDETTRWEEAIALLDATIEVCGNEAMRRKLTLFLTNYGIKAGNNGHWEEAVKALRRAYELDQHTIRIIQNLVIALRNLAEEYYVASRGSSEQAESLLLEAQTILETALVEDPDSDKLVEALNTVREELEALRAANHTSNVANEIITPAELSLLLLLQEDKLEAAAAEGRKALQELPRRKQLLAILSRVFVRMRNVEGVIEMQRLIVEIDPTEAFKAGITIGNVYLANGRSEDAFDAFWEAAKLETCDDKQRASACRGMAEALIVQKQWNDAKAMVAKALKLDPHSKETQKTQRELTMARVRYGDFDSEEELSSLLTELAREFEQQTPSSQSVSTEKKGQAPAPDVASVEATMGNIERYLQKMRQLKYYRQGADSFIVSFNRQASKVLKIEIRIVATLVCIGTPLPEEFPDEALALYNLFRATYITDIFKVGRTRSGELYIAGEVPLSTLNAEILENLIQGVGQLVEHSFDDLPQLLACAHSIQQQTQKVEYLLIQRFGIGSRSSDLLPILAGRAGLAYETIGPSHFLLTFGLRDFPINVRCSECSVSFIAAVEDMARQAHVLSYLHRIAEINLKMEICKIALDEEDDLTFLWELPALSEELFEQLIQMMDRYLSRYVEELDSK